MDKDFQKLTQNIDRLREENRAQGKAVDTRLDGMLQALQLLAQSMVASNDRAETNYEKDQRESRAILTALERQGRALDKQSNLLAALTAELLKRSKNGHNGNGDKNGGNGKKK